MGVERRRLVTERQLGLRRRASGMEVRGIGLEPEVLEYPVDARARRERRR